MGEVNQTCGLGEERRVPRPTLGRQPVTRPWRREAVNAAPPSPPGTLTTDLRRG